MEKTQAQQDSDSAQTKKGKTKSTPTEKRSRAVALQGVDDSRLVSEISKMSAITPYAVSSQFNIRIGAARDILEELEKRKLLTSVGGNARVRIYRAVAA
jgi:ribosomal protein S25